MKAYEVPLTFAEHHGQDIRLAFTGPLVLWLKVGMFCPQCINIKKIHLIIQKLQPITHAYPDHAGIQQVTSWQNIRNLVTLFSSPEPKAQM